jgi:hypothetical protein
MGVRGMFSGWAGIIASKPTPTVLGDGCQGDVQGLGWRYRWQASSHILSCVHQVGGGGFLRASLLIGPLPHFARGGHRAVGLNLMAILAS